MKFFTLSAVLLICLWSCTDERRLTPSETDKRIALTYDDAPRGNGPRFSGPERTAAFIQQLQTANSGPVAIFVTTKGLDSPEGVERIKAYASAGHLIANHSDTHMWASRTPIDAYIKDLDQAEEKLQNFENRRPWYRFPYLDEGGYGKRSDSVEKRDALRLALKDRALINGYVTVDTYDWHLESLWQKAMRDKKTVDMTALSNVYSDMVVDAANHYDRLGQQVLGRRPAQVLLLHENDLAASFTIDAIRALRADGWMIIDPDIAFADQIAQTIPTTTFSGMGRISAIAVDKGLKGPDILDHWSASESAIEAKLLESSVFSTTD